MPTTDPRLQAIFDQLETILLLLERPVIQNQMFAFLAIFLLSWLLPAPLGVQLNKLLTQQNAIRKRREKMNLPVNAWRVRLLRWLRGAQLLIFPVVGLISSQVTIGYFEAQQWPLGLLERLAVIFWLLLVYRLVGGLLFGSVEPARAKTYHRRFVTPIFIILVGVIASTGLGGAFPIFGIELFRIADTPLTLKIVAIAALILYATMAVTWITDEVLRTLVLPRAQANTGVSNTILTITRYAVIGVGVLIAISTVGVNLSAFAIIGGGLSVGIGFGLQDLVANFISGILLLFEQTLRPGDIIEVTGQRGKVSQMRMRSAVLRTAENVDIYVPNKTLLTSTVAAYTNISKTVRKTLRVGVSYDSDPIEVRDTLEHAIESHGLVLKDPAPAVLFIGFGSFTLDFEVSVSIADGGRAAQVLSDLHFMIYREFSKHGIEIPIPQQDFNLRTTSIQAAEQLIAVQVDEPTQSNGKHKAETPPPTQGTEKDHPKRGDKAKSDNGHGDAAKNDTAKNNTEKVIAEKLPPDRVKALPEKANLPG